MSVTDILSVPPVSPETSAEFQLIVGKLKTLKLRGDEVIQHSVEVIREYQKKFGDSEKQLKLLAAAVGVTTRTFYRWIKQVENPTKPPKKLMQKSKPTAITKHTRCIAAIFYVARHRTSGRFYNSLRLEWERGIQHASAYQIEPGNAEHAKCIIKSIHDAHQTPLKEIQLYGVAAQYQLQLVTPARDGTEDSQVPNQVTQ